MSIIITKLKSIFFSRDTSSLEKLELVLMIGMIFSIFFPVRYVLENKFSTILGYYSDFTAISIYLSFFFIISFIMIGVIRNIKDKNHRATLYKIILAFILGLVLYQTNLDPNFRIISVYFYLRITCAILLGYYVYKSPIWLKYKGLFLWTIVLIGSFQAVLALLQFGFQHSFGLNVLGESPLAVSLYGVAKVVSRGTTYIRGYGTLPHPNILGGLLVISSLLNLYLLNNSSQRYNKILLILSQFLIILGLFVTFSRSAFLALAVGLTTWGIITMVKNKSLLFIRKLWIIPVSIVISIFIFFPWLESRGNIQDQSATERGIYNQVGLQILENNWVIGTGPGTNMFHMKQKLEYQLEAWNIQPIHNFWLIMLSEWGIIGLFMGLFILGSFYRILRKFLSRDNLSGRKPISGWEITLISISVSLLSLFWFDHYFYTIWPTQIMLVLVLGLIWITIVPREI